MFHKILVAVDRSDMSQQGCGVAISLTEATGAKLILLHVLSAEDEECPHLPVLLGQDFYPGHASRSVVQIYEDLWATYAAREQALLQPLATAARAKGIQTDTVQQVGHAGRVICDLARDAGVDLIIVGRRGGSRLDELILGSVSNYVLHHAPCSVLVMHAQSETVAVDPHKAAIASN